MYNDDQHLAKMSLKLTFFAYPVFVLSRKLLAFRICLRKPYRPTNLKPTMPLVSSLDVLIYCLKPKFTLRHRILAQSQ